MLPSWLGHCLGWGGKAVICGHCCWTPQGGRRAGLHHGDQWGTSSRLRWIATVASCEQHTAGCGPQEEGQIAFLGLRIFPGAASGEHSFVSLCSRSARLCVRARVLLARFQNFRCHRLLHPLVPFVSSGFVSLRPCFVVLVSILLASCRVLPRYALPVPSSPAIKGSASAGTVVFLLFFFLRRSELLSLAVANSNSLPFPVFSCHCLFFSQTQSSPTLERDLTVAATGPHRHTPQSQSFLIPYKHAYRKQIPHEQQGPPGPAACIEEARWEKPPNRP